MTTCQGCTNCACKADMAKVESVWRDSVPKFEQHSVLSQDMEVDVCIVGGGITGLTAAWLLLHAGKTVAVVEKDTLGAGVTGYTSAHLTAVLDLRYTALRKRFGLQAARQLAQDSQAAISFIQATVAKLGIDCDLATVPGYLFAANADDVRKLQEEATLMQELGLSARFNQDMAFPAAKHGGIIIDNQGQVHPLKYIQGLATAVTKAGGHIFEHTLVADLQGRKVITDKGVIQAKQVILATHTPPFTRFLTVQAKLEAWQSYVIAVRLVEGAQVPTGLWYDTLKPYHYVRSFIDDKGPLLIIGGEDVRSGTGADSAKAFGALVNYAKQYWPVSKVAYTWSSMYFDSVDMVPYIGAAPFTPGVWVATGYAGNGLTYGTAAARQIVAQILGTADKAAVQLYSPGRISGAALWPLTKAGINNAKHFCLDRLKRAPAGNTEELAANEGKLMQLNGKQVAAYKDEAGKVTLLSPVCTHAGCIVEWNNGERTWDCPCHGSRFTATGAVLMGPATKDLSTIK